MVQDPIQNLDASEKTKKNFVKVIAYQELQSRICSHFKQKLAVDHSFFVNGKTDNQLPGLTLKWILQTENVIVYKLASTL